MGQTLSNVRKWLYARKDSLPKNDMVLLVLNEDKLAGATAGISGIGVTCKVDETEGDNHSLVIFNDNGDYSSGHGIAHEMGHK